MDDFTSDTETTGIVAVEGSVQGTLETADDLDWFAMDLVAGTAYLITLTGQDGGGGSLGDPMLAILDDAGTEVAFSDDFNGLDSGVVFSPATSGTYFAQAMSFSAGSSGTYTLEVADLGDDLPDSVSTPASIAVGETVSSDFFGPYEADWFSTTLETGTVYQVAVTVDTDEEYFDGWVELYDAEGNYLTDRYYSESSTPGFVVESDGAYFLGISTYMSAADYSVSLTDAGPDIPSGPASDATLVLDTPIQSNIFGYDDSDSFNVTLEAEQLYQISFAVTEGMYFDVDFLLEDATATTGTYVGYGYGTTETRFVFEAEESGDFLLTLFSYAGGSDYELTLSEFEVPEDVGQTAETAGTLDDEGAATGRFETSEEQDWYAVSLDAGVQYRAVLAPVPHQYGLSFGPAYEPSVSLVDADGTVLSAATPPNYSNMAVNTAPVEITETGTYFVVVDAGVTDDYNEDFDPDYEVTLESAVAVDLTGTEAGELLEGGFTNDMFDGAGGDDSIRAGAGNDTVLGGAGNDHIAAMAGNDEVDAGAGDDLVGGGTGQDRVIGGDGNDTVQAGQDNDFVQGGAGNDHIWGGTGDDLLFGGSGGDTFGAGRGRDKIYAGSGDDVVGAGGGADFIWLGSGNDNGFGGAGNDTIFGGVGADDIQGGGNDDWINGGAGDDTLNGGWGSDTFYFTVVDGETDVILDFQKSDDDFYYDDYYYDDYYYDEYYYYGDSENDLIMIDVAGTPDDFDPVALYNDLTIEKTDGSATLQFQGHEIQIEGDAFSIAALSETDIIFV